MDDIRQASIRAAATIILLAAVVLTNAAHAQTLVEPSARTSPPRHGASLVGDRAKRPDVATASNESQPPPASDARRGPYRRPFLTAIGFVPLATYVAAAGPQASDVLYPSDRFAIAQIVVGGYVVNPRFRFGTAGIFSEVLSGLPGGASTWQFGGVAPVAIGTLNHFIIGGGPLFEYRATGRWQSNVGAVILTGASIPVRKGLAVNIAVPVTTVFTHRSTASVGVAAGLAKVF
jgi:hypothetical protein